MDLYRYFTSSRAIQALQKGKLYLSTLDRYNDPFELLPQTNYLDLIVLALKEHGLTGTKKPDTGEQPAHESHYSDRHRGIVLSFSDSLDYWSGVNLKKVDYSPLRPELPTKDGVFNDYVWELLTTKATYWRYEKEVRLICMDKNRRTANIHPESVKGIILGARCAPEDAAEVLKIRDEKYPQARIFQAKLSKDDYKLTIEDI